MSKGRRITGIIIIGLILSIFYYKLNEIERGIKLNIIQSMRIQTQLLKMEGKFEEADKNNTEILKYLKRWF